MENDSRHMYPLAWIAGSRPSFLITSSSAASLEIFGTNTSGSVDTRSVRAPALPAQSWLWGEAGRERAVRPAATVGRGAEPPSEATKPPSEVINSATGELRASISEAAQATSSSAEVPESTR